VSFVPIVHRSSVTVGCLPDARLDMVVALVSSPSDIASLEASLDRGGWRTWTSDIHDGTLRSEVRSDLLVEIGGDSAPRTRVALLLSVGFLQSTRMLERVIARYREQGIPVIVVAPSATQSSGRELLARAMTAGADDFVVATSVQDELLLRVEALAWRPRPAREQRPHPVYDIAIDRASRRLCHKGVHVALTPCEFRVFSCLARSAGRTVSRASIQQCLAPDSRSRTTNLVDVYILYVRRKLAELDCSCVIRTVRGVGYALVAAPASESPRTQLNRSEADPAEILAS